MSSSARYIGHRFGLLAALCLFFLSQEAAGLPVQVSDDTVCIKDGIRSTKMYRQAVLVGDNHFLPVYSNVDLSKSVKVDNLLIIQHGKAGNANTYFCNAVSGVKGHIKSIGVVAPYFGNKSVTLGKWVTTCSDATEDCSITSLYWHKTSWNRGGGAKNARSISSFKALDALLGIVTKCPYSRRDSHCAKQIIMAGFSAGGQTYQRYAWATSYGLPGGTTTRHVAVKFVVSDPGTYLYFDARRANEPCRPHNNTGPKWTCTDFVDYTPFRPSCPKFNDYKLGLDNLTAALTGSPYFKHLRTTPANMSAAYLTKNILYVLGEDDVCNCQTSGFINAPICIRNQTCKPHGNNTSPHCCDMPAPNPHNVMTQTGCGEMLQGSNRLQRGLLFMSYLKVFSGGSFTPHFTTVPGMGHEPSKLYSVQAFLNFLAS